ncbi:MAG: HD domain-containing protein [Bacilli bacterium]|nr:HD domain-containing protein [Bacilli bacterium]
MMMFTEKEKDIIEKAKIYVKNILGNDASGHDYNHILRVYNMALHLNLKYQANWYIISLGALLHDIDDYKISNSKIPDERTRKFFEDNSLEEETRDRVIDIINTISYSKQIRGVKVTSLEGKIVQDADRLDALGAIGIARTFAFGGSKNRLLYDENDYGSSSLAHFYDKLFKLADLMNTAEAKKIAKKRTKFMRKYVDNFKKEWEGKIEN